MVSKSWHMYLIGFLFGLGFDTATEVGILAVSAHGGQVGMPFWTIMLLPALFTVGMCLVDTSDGILMLGAYGWAFIKPIRKLYYNLCITLLSVLVAFIVGTYELLQIMQAQFHPRGAFWDTVGRLNFDNLGFVIIGTFVAGWLGVHACLQVEKVRDPSAKQRGKKQSRKRKPPKIGKRLFLPGGGEPPIAGGINDEGEQKVRAYGFGGTPSECRARNLVFALSCRSPFLAVRPFLPFALSCRWLFFLFGLPAYYRTPLTSLRFFV